MKKRRILMVIDSLAAGGAEKVALNLASAFLDEACSIDIITIDDIVSYEVDAAIKVHTLAFKKGAFEYQRNAKRLHQMIEVLSVEEGFDRIIVHLQKSTRLMRSFHHDKIFFVVHSTLSQASLSGRSGMRRWLKVRRLKGIYDGLNLIAVSQGIAEDIKSIGITPKHLEVINNPVDIRTLKAKAEEKMACECPDEYIVYVGRLATSKRHDRAIDAYYKSEMKAHFCIVGEGERREAIERQVEALSLKEQIHLCGFQNNPYPIIKGARLLVLTSDYEGLPTVLIEALSLGTAVVSVDCPSGPREILAEAMPECLVPLDDEEALLRAMLEQMRAPSSIPEVLLERFEPQGIAGKYLSLGMS